MARLNIAPTKSSQLTLKADLAVVTEGHSLLDQKREILVMEMMRLLERVRTAQRKLDTVQAAAMAALRRAMARNGYHQTRNIASSARFQHHAKVQSQIVAGVRIPRITVEHSPFAPQFGLASSDSLLDETMFCFAELTKAVGEMAELETAVWLLARDLKKTQRRVNALEQIFIPDYRETLRYISETLESKELEAFSLMKIVKRRTVDKRKKS